MQIVGALPQGMEALNYPVFLNITGLYNQSYTVELTHDLCTHGL